MSKPLAVAIMRDGFHSSQERRVPIIRSKAIGCVASFHAPAWRSMAFRSVERATAKAASHPLFLRWEA